MYKNLYELCQYAKDSGRLSSLELPLELKDNNLVNLLRIRFDKYMSLLVSFLDKKLSPTEAPNIKNKYLPYLEKIQVNMLDIIKNGETAYPSFKTTLDEINKEFDLFNKVTLNIRKNQELYRLCSYRNDLKEAKEFYHCPNTNIENNKQSRFGGKKDILWYLGYTREVCIECEAREITACIALFRLKTNEKLKLLDLTQGNLFSKNNSKTDCLCYIFWWLIACCYCGYDKYDANDHNTYTIPQMLSKYIKENYLDIDGIKYYTVRNALLNPNENTYVNVAFFTRNYNEEGYDMDLCGKFEMISSEQNIKIQH